MDGKLGTEKRLATLNPTGRDNRLEKMPGNIERASTAEAESWRKASSLRFVACGQAFRSHSKEKETAAVHHHEALGLGAFDFSGTSRRMFFDPHGRKVRPKL